MADAPVMATAPALTAYIVAVLEALKMSPKNAAVSAGPRASRSPRPRGNEIAVGLGRQAAGLSTASSTRSTSLRSSNR